MYTHTYIYIYIHPGKCLAMSEITSEFLLAPLNLFQVSADMKSLYILLYAGELSTAHQKYFMCALESMSV